MNRAIALGLGVALALQGAPSPAQNKASSGTRYDCDTPANRFSDLTIPAGRVPFIVTGKVRFASATQSAQLAPMTRMAISSAAGAGATNEGWAGFEYAMLPDPADSQQRRAQLAFTLRQAGGANSGQPLGAPSADEVEFSMYDGTAVLVIVDGKPRRMPFAVAVPAIKIVCSTGEFVYSDLRINPLD
jgi:hypothetical protein